MVFKEQKKTDKLSFDKKYRGKKKGYVADVHWSAHHKYWFFSITSPDGNRYNSLWGEMKYSTQDECEIAAEQYIDEQERK